MNKLGEANGNVLKQNSLFLLQATTLNDLPDLVEHFVFFGRCWRPGIFPMDPDQNFMHK